MLVSVLHLPQAETAGLLRSVPPHRIYIYSLGDTMIYSRKSEGPVTCQTQHSTVHKLYIIYIIRTKCMNNLTSTIHHAITGIINLQTCHSDETSWYIAMPSIHIKIKLMQVWIQVLMTGNSQRQYEKYRFSTYKSTVTTFIWRQS